MFCICISRKTDSLKEVLTSPLLVQYFSSYLVSGKHFNEEKGFARTPKNISISLMPRTYRESHCVRDFVFTTPPFNISVDD